MATVTFDFHNTLASCDAWFDLEVRSLPRRVYERLSGNDSPSHDYAKMDEITGAYRAVRSEVMAHGDELDALEGTVETFRRVGIGYPAGRIAEVIHEVMHSALSDLAPRPGAIDLVAELHGRGLQLGVISSAVYHPFIEWSLERFAMASAFTAVVSSASAGYYKSRPEIYHVAMDRLAASPQTTAHVGDSFRFDHLTAQSVGLRTVWVAPETAEPPDGPSPDLRIASLEGAADAIVHLTRAGRP